MIHPTETKRHRTHRTKPVGTKPIGTKPSGTKPSGAKSSGAAANPPVATAVKCASAGTSPRPTPAAIRRTPRRTARAARARGDARFDRHRGAALVTPLTAEWGRRRTKYFPAHHLPNHRWLRRLTLRLLLMLLLLLRLLLLLLLRYPRPLWRAPSNLVAPPPPPPPPRPTHL